MSRIRRGPQLFTGRKVKEIPVGGTGSPFVGLNTAYPHTQLRDGESPNYYNVRLYARKASDRRVAVGTRKGPGFYSVPLGETADVSATSVTGASDASLTPTTWKAEKFTAGATGRLTKIELNVKEGTSPTQHMIVEIYSDSSGAPGTLLATSSILSSDITSSYAYAVARFIEAPQVTSASVYWVVAYMQMGGSGNWNWSSTTATSTALTSADSGGSWSATSYSLNLKTYVSTDSPFLGGFKFNPSTATSKTIIAHGTNVYSVSEVDGSTTSIKSGLNASATEYNYAQADDKVFWVNGYDTPFYYDNSTTTAITDTEAPAGKFCAFHKGRLFIAGQAADPTRLAWSEFADYTNWVSTGFTYVPQSKTGDEITGMTVFQDNLIIFTRKTKYILFGDDPGNFVLRQSSGKKGAVNQACIASDPNYVYFLSDDGVYRYNGSQDELMSDPIQTEIDNIADKEKTAGVYEGNYYRLYYPQTGSTVNDSCILWDTLNKFWLRDSNTYVDKPFTDANDTLIEGSSLIGAVYYAEQAYSDLGKPIEFVYWSKIFGDGLRKLFLRRFTPSIRLQTQPYSLNIYIDVDQRNANVLQYTLDALATGSTYGSGITFGSGETYGSRTVGVPETFAGTEAFWHQIRYEQTGVDTPVEILSYVLQIRVRRTE
jgi:hypothetical protein